MKDHKISITVFFFYTAAMVLVVLFVSRCNQNKTPMMDTPITLEDFKSNTEGVSGIKKGKPDCEDRT